MYYSTLNLDWKNTLSNKYKSEDFNTIKEMMQEMLKLVKESKVKREDDKKAQTKIIAIEMLKDTLMRLKNDQVWLHKSIITKFYEYLTFNSVCMFLKAQWIKVLREIVEEREVEINFLRTDYLLFHSHLISLIVSTIDFSSLDPTLGTGLADPAIVKWDIGLYKFIKTTNPTEYNNFMNPNNYAKPFKPHISPNNTFNNEWLLIALKHSFRIIKYIFSVANNSVILPAIQLRSTVEEVLKAFMLFQSLSELELPISPWEVTQEKWKESTQKKIIECKSEILSIIIQHTKIGGPVPQLLTEIVYISSNEIDAKRCDGKYLYSEMCGGCRRCRIIKISI